MKSLNLNLSRLWWIPLLTGLISIGLGIWIFLAPILAVPVMAIIFAACLLAVGILNIALGTMTRSVSPIWGWNLALGIIEIIGGVWMLCLPPTAMEIAFLFIVGIMVLVAAINAVSESFVLAANNGWWAAWSILLLIATIVLAIIMFGNPLAWGAASVICLGCALICFGSYRIGLSIALKRLGKKAAREIGISI